MKTSLFSSDQAFSSAQERAFRRTYLAAGVSWVATSAAAGGIAYLIFFFVAIVSGKLNQAEFQVIRIFLASLLLFCAVALRREWIPERFIERFIVLSIGTTMVGTVLLIIRSSSLDGSQFLLLSGPTSLVMMNFLVCSFSRLSLRMSAVLTLGSTLGCALFLLNSIPFEAFIRLCVYFLISSVAGLYLVRLMESRERTLFRQRQALEDSFNESEVHSKNSDIAKQAALESKLKAESSEQQKGRLIAAISHDLRQPLTAAMMQLDILKSKLDVSSNDQSVRGAVDKVSASIEMISTTLNQLMSVAQVENPNSSIRSELIFVETLFDDLADAYADVASKKGLQLRFKTSKKSRIAVMSDPDALHRIVGNLLSNAIKYTDSREGSRSGVLVAAFHRGDTVRIDVIDNGIGIPDDKSEKIWEAYLQLHAPQRDRQFGLGLGLYLVQQAVSRLPNHSVSMKSIPGKGSKFSLRLPGVSVKRLPLSQFNDYEAPQKLSQLPDPVDFKDSTIVVIDDDQDIRESISETLSKRGAQVVSGVSLDSAVASLDLSKRISAVICDYRLGAGENGVQVLKLLSQKLGYSPKSILITGTEEIGHIISDNPTLTVMRKPFSGQQLIQELSN